MGSRPRIGSRAGGNHQTRIKMNQRHAASIIRRTTLRSRAGVADWMAYQSHPGPLFAHGLYHLRATRKLRHGVNDCLARFGGF
jgi:hypothetical protein